MQILSIQDLFKKQMQITILNVMRNARHSSKIKNVTRCFYYFNL